MNFVYERPSDADKEALNLSHVEGRFGRPIDVYKWVIDKETDVILVWASGGSEDDPYHTRFLFHWKGRRWYIGFQLLGGNDSSGVLNLSWHSEGRTVPDDLLEYKGEIVSALKIALHQYACGSGRRTDVVSSYDF